MLHTFIQKDCYSNMAKFIELIDKNNRNTLVNVDNIASVVIYKDPEEEVRIYFLGNDESYITIKETYAEIKEMLKAVTDVSAN
jgi:nucleoside-diphosphate-sugar epimerase